MSASITPDFVLSREQNHSKFSRRIPPVATVPSGSVIEAHTHEATGGQFHPESTTEALSTVDMERVHTLTGPVYVEGAEPGDVLAVSLLEIEVGDWGWMALIPHFGVLAEDFDVSLLKTFSLRESKDFLEFTPGVRVPLKPFPGIMGVAPPTDEMLGTIPPRANGGNLDDPSLTAGTTVYFPVFAPGALFSLGDGHAAQGYGEVCGTGLEVPLRVVYEVRVIKGGPRMEETQYENDTLYATTAFGESIDEAARKATRYMVAHLVETHGLTREKAYMLCSLAGDLKIAEAVNEPHRLVTMQLPKAIFVDL